MDVLFLKDIYTQSRPALWIKLMIQTKFKQDKWQKYDMKSPFIRSQLEHALEHIQVHVLLSSFNSYPIHFLGSIKSVQCFKFWLKAKYWVKIKFQIYGGRCFKYAKMKARLLKD